MLADDTEALIVRVPEDETQPPECHLVPIDACYEFVGRLRMLWRGFDGGQDVRELHRRVLRSRRLPQQGRRQMTSPSSEVTFAVLDVAPEPYAVTPVLTARIGVAAVGDDPVHAIALRCQVRIEPLRRGYTDEEAAGLLDLFGPRERWGNTQRTFLWQHSTAMVQGFSGATQVDLPLECTYDFEVAAAKYLHALRDGAIPLQFLFSGTIFTQGDRGFAVQQVPWDCEDRLRHAGRGLARPDRAALPEQRVGPAAARHRRRAGRLQVGARPARTSTTPSRRCLAPHAASRRCR